MAQLVLANIAFADVEADGLDNFTSHFAVIFPHWWL